MLISKDSFTLILPVTMPVKKRKGAARQCYGDGDGVVRCEQTLRPSLLFIFCRVFTIAGGGFSTRRSNVRIGKKLLV